MEKIRKIELEALKNAEHYELTHSVQEFAEKCALITGSHRAVETRPEVKIVSTRRWKFVPRSK